METLQVLLLLLLPALGLILAGAKLIHCGHEREHRARRDREPQA